MMLFQLLPGVMLFVFCVYSFIREVKLDYLRYLERDRLGDEHILKEIERFLKEKGEEITY